MRIYVDLTVTLLLVIAIMEQFAYAADWNYNDTSPYGPPSWSVHYPGCGGQSQSPIDVTQDHVEEIISNPLTFLDYSHKPQAAYVIQNSGHGVTIQMPKDTFRIRDGGLPSTFTLEQIHFHWSQLDTLGSEHVVNKRIHPLEIHFVHYDSERFSDVKTAVEDPNGLAVLSVNVEIASEHEDESLILGHISESLQRVINYGNETEMESFALEELLPAHREFYRYTGSLTTPGCAESVHWTLFTQSIYIKAEHMIEFRHIRSDKGEILQKNFRPVQPINDRIIYHYYDGISGASTVSCGIVTTIVLISFLYNYII